MISKILCFLFFHDPDPEYTKVLDNHYNLLKCRRCGRKFKELNDYTKSQIRHYCPICRKLEQDCQCLEC